MLLKKLAWKAVPSQKFCSIVTSEGEGDSLLVNPKGIP